MSEIDFDKYSSEDLLRIQSEMIGYTEMPPSIEKFVEDEYYLGKIFGGGKLFPIWMQRLKEIFPSPIHTRYTYIAFCGAIGTGKSTISKIIALYNHCRLDHMKDFSFLGIAETKPISFAFFHTSSAKAHSEFVGSIHEFMRISPYFQNMLTNPNVNYITDGIRVNNTIGSDVLFYNLSELNFINYAKASDKINSAIGRFKSRFQRGIGYLGNIVLDSSPTDINSPIEVFIRNGGVDVYPIRDAIWDVKKHLNIYGGKTFKVYSGDSTNNPKILEEGEDTSSLNADGIVEVPIELETEFKSDLVKALRDNAGVYTGSSHGFISDNDIFQKVWEIDKPYEEVLVLDFYNRDDTMMSHMIHAIPLIPKSKRLYISVDFGVSNDFTGIAVGYFEDYIYPNGKNTIYREPLFKIPVAVALNRKPGQQTAINKVEEFVLDLSNMGYEIGFVSADQYQSTQFLQKMQQSGIESSIVSVDRNDIQYILFKNLLYKSLVKLPKSILLRKELSELVHHNGKVDHPPGGSKDIADAVCACVFNLHRDLDVGSADLSATYNLKTSTDMINLMRENRPPNSKEEFWGRAIQKGFNNE